jgi:hypothetical protein
MQGGALQQQSSTFCPRHGAPAHWRSATLPSRTLQRRVLQRKGPVAPVAVASLDSASELTSSLLSGTSTGPSTGSSANQAKAQKKAATVDDVVLQTEVRRRFG